VDAALTGEPRAVAAVTAPAAGVRTDTLTLCQQVREAEARHFPAWCAVIDNQRSRRPRELPSDVVELEHERLADVNAAVERLREHCALDMDRAERECHALMRLQVEGDLASTAALRVTRGGEAREAIRSTANEQRTALFETRDALCCGRGWPHTGELVIATASIYDSTADGGERVHQGACVYTGSYDTHNTSHTVQAPGLGEFHLAWEPHEHWGNADPNGDITMRVAARAERRLPCPLPRWPTEADVDGIDEHAGLAVGEQMPLL
jgi:hypothetical protein